jgi:hypothetical protein
VRSRLERDENRVIDNNNRTWTPMEINAARQSIFALKDVPISPCARSMYSNETNALPANTETPNSAANMQAPTLRRAFDACGVPPITSALKVGSIGQLPLFV